MMELVLNEEELKEFDKYFNELTEWKPGKGPYVSLVEFDGNMPYIESLRSHEMSKFIERKRS